MMLSIRGGELATWTVDRRKLYQDDGVKLHFWVPAEMIQQSREKAKMMYRLPSNILVPENPKTTLYLYYMLLEKKG